MGSFILGVVLISILTFVLAGLPAIVWIILIQSAGLQDYLYAFTTILFSILNLILFFKLSLEYLDSDEHKTLSIIEIIIIVCFIVAGIFIKPHSFFFNIIYSSFIVKILAMLCIPVLIMNIINCFFADDKESIKTNLVVIGGAALLSLAFSSVVIWVADFKDNKDIGHKIQSWFVYDNNKFDKIRKDAKIESEYDFLNGELGTALNSLKETCDINEEDCYKKVKTGLYNKSNLKEYGYDISSIEWQDNDIALLRVFDKKTKEYSVYKMNYRDYSLEKSSDKEFYDLRDANK